MADQLNNYRLLGRSGLRVSPLAFGTMTFGVKGAWGSSRGSRQDDRPLCRSRRQLHRHGQFLRPGESNGFLPGR